MAVIMNLVTIPVIPHICAYVSVIMVQNHRRRMTIVRREMIPTPRRHPRSVVISAYMAEYHRSGIIYRTHNIVRSINIRRSYYFYIVIAIGRNFRYNRSDILINVRSKDCLDDKNVIIALHC